MTGILLGGLRMRGRKLGGKGRKYRRGEVKRRIVVEDGRWGEGDKERT